MGGEKFMVGRICGRDERFYLRVKRRTCEEVTEDETGVNEDDELACVERSGSELRWTLNLKRLPQ